jgi:succinate-acetate transporter protein
MISAFILFYFIKQSHLWLLLLFVLGLCVRMCVCLAEVTWGCGFTLLLVCFLHLLCSRQITHANVQEAGGTGILGAKTSVKDFKEGVFCGYNE